MNRIQEAIAKVTGVDEQIHTLMAAVEHTSGENALLMRQIEDLDYLNMFDLHRVAEVINIKDRKQHYLKLRRIRQENPLAKQSIKLITRFALGNGVQVSIGPDPEKAPSMPMSDSDGTDTEPAAKLNGLFPGPRNNNSRSGAGLKPLPRARPQVSEAVEMDDEDQLKEIITSFWSDKENQKAFTSHEAMKDWLDGVATDGEKFFIGFTSEVAPYVRLTEIPGEEIVEIIYHPDNWKVPVYYKRVYQDLIYEEDSGYKVDGEPKTRYYLDHADFSRLDLG